MVGNTASFLSWAAILFSHFALIKSVLQLIIVACKFTVLYMHYLGTVEVEFRKAFIIERAWAFSSKSRSFMERGQQALKLTLSYVSLVIGHDAKRMIWAIDGFLHPK